MRKETSSSKVLGLELSGGLLKLALLSYQRGTPNLEQLFSLTMGDDSSHAAAVSYHSEEAQQVAALAPQTLQVSSIEANMTLVRPLEIKLQKLADIDAVLAFQAEPLLPYPVENAVIDRVVVDKVNEGTLLMLHATRKDHLQSYLSQWSAWGVEPEVIGSTANSLAAFSRYTVNNSKPHFVLHLGMEQICCILVKNNKAMSAQSTLQNLGYLKQALASDKAIGDTAELNHAFSHQEWGSLSSEELPKAAVALEQLRREISRIAFALAKQGKEVGIPPILLTGEGALYDSLAEVLTASLQPMKISLQPTFLTKVPAELLQNHAIAIGSALTALPGYEDQVNFRQGEYAYPHPWKRLKLPAICYGAAMAALLVAFYLFSQSYLGLREDDLRHSYAQLLEQMNRPYDEVEQSYASKQLGYKGTAALPITPLKGLSTEELEARVGFLQKELQATPDYYPLLPQVPRVSDLLAWLLSQPQVVGSDVNSTPLRIEGLSYTMAKRPEQTKKLEKYQVRVELEFSSRNPTDAREFHDALLVPNSFIDAKQGVKWSAAGGKYKAVFFLNDRTPYP